MNKAEKLTHKHPELGTGPVSIEPYISEEIFELEKEKVFKKSWLSVAHESDLPEPGSFITRDIAVLDTSIIIVRVKDGTIKAFHNVCKHRGHRVALEKCGKTSAFRCLFHAWTYSIDGDLVAVPDEKNFFDLDKSHLGLEPVAVDTWEKFIFINVDPSPKETLDESMGELFDQFDGYDSEGWVPATTMRIEQNCNWKLIMDAFQEAYHVIALHENSAPQAFSSNDNPFAHLNDIRLYKKHRAISVFGNPEQNIIPSAEVNIKYANSGIYVTSENSEEQFATTPKGVNPDKRKDYAFDISLVHPNFSFYTAYGWVLAARYWPVSAEKSIYEATLYMPPALKPSQRVAMEQSIAHLFDVVLEDASTVERTQDILHSGAIKAMPLSDMELAIRHGAKVIADEIEA